jgi:uncharacterized protein (DUF849 family)
MHLLEKHRDAIITTSSNKSLLDECIKSRNGYVRVVLKTATGTDDYWVSFAYNSGWNGKPKMAKVLEKIKEHRDAHIEVCKSLFSDILAYEKDKKEAKNPAMEKPMDAKESSMEMKLLTTRYEELLAKYNTMEKKKNTTEASNDRLRSRIRMKENATNVLLKLYDIDHMIYSCIEEEIANIWREYPECEDDASTDDKNEGEREKLMDVISLEEMKKNASYDAEDDIY